MLCVFLILQVFCISVSCTLYRIHGKGTEKHQIQSRKEENLISSQTATISFDRTLESDTDTWEVVVQENNLPGSMVMEVSAYASDPELDKDIMYTLSEPTMEAYGDIFELQEDRKSLHPRGILIAKQSLDFEDAAEYRLLVVASLGDPGIKAIRAHCFTLFLFKNHGQNLPSLLRGYAGCAVKFFVSPVCGHRLRWFLLDSPPLWYAHDNRLLSFLC